MRIIAGSLRSRTLQAPPGLATRPTSDRLRETLFNVLAPRIAGAVFCDLYAGSGAVGIEALSRGAAHVTFVERATPAVKVLRANLNRLGLTQNFSIVSSSVKAFLSRPMPAAADGTSPNIVFLDPPYDAAQEYATTLAALAVAPSTLLAPGAVVIAEHRRKEKLADIYGTLNGPHLARTRLLEQGDAALSFYAPTEPTEASK